MKINEMEALVGVTKKNIRFYEEQGLLSPRRNSENGYREYGEAEIETLRRIKLMRKLGVPIPEIRLMLMICWSAVIAPEEAPPLPLLAFLTALPAAAILGILLALIQRIREIGKGEAEDAKRY